MNKKISIRELSGDLKTYFNWSCNAVMPINSGAADIYLMQNRHVIEATAKLLLNDIKFIPQTLYRGIILRQPVKEITPKVFYQYLSFSTDINVANHFADVNGFGSDLVNVSEQLGNYGYVVEYTPRIEEILFHHEFFTFLPYAEAFNLIGIDGQGEVNSLMKQKEIMIKQPTEPLKNIKPFCNETLEMPTR